MTWTPPPTPELFDEKYPDFDARDYLIAAPRHIPEPDYREALRRMYEARLYEIASKNEAAPVLSSIRPWYRKAWAAIEQGQEREFAGEVLDELMKDSLHAFEWKNLFNVFMACCLREQATAIAQERFEKACKISDAVDDAVFAWRDGTVEILDLLDELWPGELGTGEDERKEVGKLLVEMASLPRFYVLTGLDLVATLAERLLPMELQVELLGICDLLAPEGLTGPASRSLIRSVTLSLGGRLGSCWMRWYLSYLPRGKPRFSDCSVGIGKQSPHVFQSNSRTIQPRRPAVSTLLLSGWTPFLVGRKQQ
ncbi:MAG: hypothetical protein ACYTG0_06670 [Planctomycetota bacterium]|jgi:hypothetical protein